GSLRPGQAVRAVPAALAGRPARPRYRVPRPAVPTAAAHRRVAADSPPRPAPADRAPAGGLAGSAGAAGLPAAARRARPGGPCHRGRALGHDSRNRRVRTGGRMDVSGKVAIVTGAGRGLGRAYALALARSGAAVVVNDVDAEAAKQVAERARVDGGKAVAEPGAVGPTATADALVARAFEEFGRLDGLVANAGVLRDRMVWRMS